jgi:hypothetical protein
MTNKDFDNPKLDSPQDHIIRWRLGDPRFKTRSQLRRDKMQRQYTIDLRVDFSDPNKNDDLRKAVARAARHVWTVAKLIADGQEPQIAAYSDDHFSGHEDISILDDVITKGLEELGEDVTGPVEEGISAELLEAARESEGS